MSGCVHMGTYFGVYAYGCMHLLANPSPLSCVLSQKDLGIWNSMLTLLRAHLGGRPHTEGRVGSSGKDHRAEGRRQ